MRETAKTVITESGIWTKPNTLKNDWVAFRKTFVVKQRPSEAELVISADTKYWLYVNGALVVNEGGLFRESMPGCGYADKIDIAPWLKAGENLLAVLVWYYGNEGRNNIDSTRAGLMISCPALSLTGDSSFLCSRHPGYGRVEGHVPSYLYGGDDISYQAGTFCEGFELPGFDDSAFSPAAVYPNECWGELYERPIPLHKLGEECVLQENSVRGEEHCFVLPYAMTFSPSLTVNAAGGEVLRFYTDHSVVNGGSCGDEVFNTYNSHIFEYRCKAGENRYRFPAYLYGEKLFVSYPPTIAPELKIRESGYDCTITGSFHCDCEILNRTIEKAARTLYVCMRDNFMDCPDRERGQWIGDVSVQAPQVMYLLSESARKLLKKSIFDFINLRKGDVLVGNVPGAHFSELPSQSLNAISEVGLIAQYYHYTGDKSVLELAFEPAVRYLKLWSVQENGLVAERKGDWYWFDHSNNIDAPVLENAWYYSALSFAQRMAEILGDHRFDDFITARKTLIGKAFHKTFWKKFYYSSGSVVDDRANAMAVLAGLCPENCYQYIRMVLLSTFNATVYMENYILMALCEMGYYKDAYRRMVSRYYPLAVNENSTLWEDFFIPGTTNHAWTGAPVTIAFKYFLGLDTTDGFKTYTIHPQKEIFHEMTAEFVTDCKKVTVKVTDGEISIREEKR